MALGSTQPLTNEYQEYFLGSKGGQCVRLTTLPPSCADCLEIWEPQLPGTLRVCPGLFRACFTLTFYLLNMNLEHCHYIRVWGSVWELIFHFIIRVVRIFSYIELLVFCNECNWYFIMRQWKKKILLWVNFEILVQFCPAFWTQWFTWAAPTGPVHYFIIWICAQSLNFAAEFPWFHMLVSHFLFCYLQFCLCKHHLIMFYLKNYFQN